MSAYSKLTVDQVASFFMLTKLLRRLRATGTLHVETFQFTNEIEILGIYDVADITDVIYGLDKIYYDEDKGIIDAEEKLERLFRKRM